MVDMFKKYEHVQRVKHLFLFGDVMILVLCVLLSVWAFHYFWQENGRAEWVEIRVKGEKVGEFPLKFDRVIEVEGALGTSKIEISQRRVRIVQDPSPRQLCVLQSWLEAAHESALCLPNQLSLQLHSSQAMYDSLSY